MDVNRNNKLVSIIVPIYGVEAYLDRCIISLRNQTYRNIEIILVDDGSPDSCPSICDRHAEEDKRIRVIHKKNGGLSDARNCGITYAVGDYIAFVDSDDYISCYFVEILLLLAIENEADIVVCKYDMFSGERYEKKKENYNIIDVYCGHKQIMDNFFNKNCGISVVSWTKLYRRKLFNNIEFPVGRNYEDEATTYKVFYKASKTVYTNAVLYYYFQRSNSITGQSMGIKNLVAFTSLEEVIRFYDEKGEVKLRRKAIWRLFRTLKIYQIKIEEEIKKYGASEERQLVRKKLQELYNEKLKKYGPFRFRTELYGCAKILQEKAADFYEKKHTNL